MKYKKFVAHCSVFCRFCPFTPTHASVSWETPGLSLDKCVSACLCLCHFSHYVCVCVCFCTLVGLSSAVLWSLLCPGARVSHTKDQHTGVLMDPEQQLFIWWDPRSFHAVTPCYPTAWLSSLNWKACCWTFILAYSEGMHVPDWKDLLIFREFGLWHRWNLILRNPEFFVTKIWNSLALKLQFVKTWVLFS